MQIIKINKKEGYFEAMPDSFDDLWHLERLIQKGDLVSGTAERKIKPKDESGVAFKEKIFVELKAGETVFHEVSNQLRVMGVVTAAKPAELVPLGSHHTLEIEPGKRVKVTKYPLKPFHISRLERAKKATGRDSVLLVLMDDEAADLAFLRDTKLELKARVISTREGKRFRQGRNEKGKPYFDELQEKISALGARKVVIAGPGFEKQNFEKYLKDNNSRIDAIFKSTHSTGITGLNELVQSGKIDRVIEGFHIAEEAKAVERVLSSLSSGLAAVGLEEVKKAVDAGAASEILVEEKLMTEKSKEIEVVLDNAEAVGGKIIFVSSKSDSGRKLTGMGGIAALLRYKASLA